MVLCSHKGFVLSLLVNGEVVEVHRLQQPCKSFAYNVAGNSSRVPCTGTAVNGSGHREQRFN